MTFNVTYDRSVMDAPDYPNVHRDSYEGDLGMDQLHHLFGQQPAYVRDRPTTHIEGLETFNQR